MSIKLDEIDLSILQELQTDSSRTNVELARAVGLSPPACLRRVRRLRKSGVIRGEMAVLDPRLVGPGMTVLVRVEMERDARALVNGFRQRVLSEDAVAQCWSVTGSDDFVLLVRIPDIAAYDALVGRLLAVDLNVKRYESLVVLEELKRDLCVPLLRTRSA
jgi:Lrp/AsnC family transcriptional regulator, leucine-responsive regulatory protein